MILEEQLGGEGVAPSLRRVDFPNQAIRFLKRPRGFAVRSGRFIVLTIATLHGIAPLKDRMAPLFKRISEGSSSSRRNRPGRIIPRRHATG